VADDLDYVPSRGEKPRTILEASNPMTSTPVDPGAIDQISWKDRAEAAEAELKKRPDENDFSSLTQNRDSWVRACEAAEAHEAELAGATSAWLEHRHDVFCAQMQGTFDEMPTNRIDEIVQQCEDALAATPAEALERARAKDQAYLERNHVVAALARIYPSGIRRTDIPGWSPDWHGCVYIDLPTGQISYHYHDSHAHLFESLPPYESGWDGHDKETVYQRLGKLDALGKEKGP